MTNKWEPALGNRGAMVCVALVGYTCGKSTLMNAVGKSDVLSKTNFFELDTTVRKVVIKNLPSCFLTL
jgi:50S ribosomal subunit-associated GTPase HflX